MKEKIKAMKKSKVFKISLFFIILATIMFPVLKAYAEEQPTFSLEVTTNEKEEKPVDLKKLKRGDTIKIKVMLKNATNWQALGYTMTFDNSAFEYVSGAAYTDMDMDGLSPTAKTIAQYNHATYEKDPKQDYFSIAIGVYPEYEKDYSYNGVVGTIVLRVKDTARADYAFHVVKENSDGRADTMLSRLVKPYNPDTDEDAEYEDLAFVAEDTQAFVEVPLTDISLNVEDTFAMIGGEQKSISVTANPKDTTVEKNLSFETDQESIVAVTQEGELTANETGQAHITVHAYGKDKTVTINVTNPLKRLYFEEEKVTIKGEEQTKQLDVKADPLNADDKSVKWESESPLVASVDQDSGMVTSHKPGTAVIKAISKANDAISASITVEVVIPVTHAEIDNSTLELNKGETKDVKITYTPTIANTDIKWTIDKNDVIRIDEQKEEGSFTAKVEGIGGGTAKLTGTLTNCAEEVTCSFDVDVTVKVPLDAIKIQKDGEDVSSIDIYPNQEINLSMVLVPLDATGLEEEVADWKSMNNNVTVTSDGVVKGVNAGTTDKITVTYAQKEASIDVNVLTPVASGSISPFGDINLITSCTATAKGKCQEKLSVEFMPLNADEKPEITWGIKENNAKDVVKVEKDGTIKALKAGDTIVTATYTTFDGVSHTLETTVHVKVALEKIQFATNEILVHRNKTVDLPKIILTPANATVEKSEMHYSYDDQTIKVVGDKITGIKKGTAILKATLDGEEANLTVKVDVPVDHLTIKDQEKEVVNLVMSRGSSKTLTTEIDPIDADDLNVVWGIVRGQPTDVVSIDSNSGAINAKKKGTTKIYAQVGGVVKTVTITVKVPIQSFTADHELEILRGEKNKKAIHYTITPLDADDQEITWKSDDNTTATVDEFGVVTGLKEGNTEIKGTLKDGKSVTVSVTVKIIPLDDIDVEINKEYLKGKNYSIHVQPQPLNSTEFENIEYESLNPDIFTVDMEGNITGLKEGTGILKVKVGSIEKEVKIKIKEIHAKSIGVHQDSNSIEIGANMKLEPYANPEDCTDQLHYSFESSDPSIATVDEFGVVTGIKEGVVTIKIMADNGMTTTMKIMVVDNTQKEIEVTSIHPSDTISTNNTTHKGNKISPNTGTSSPLSYFLISLSSLFGIGMLGYYRFRLEKE